MLRLATLGGLVLLTLAAGRADDKKDVPKELAPFQGTWKPVKVTRDGKDDTKSIPKDGRYVITGDKMTVKFDARENTGTVSVNPKKEPAEIDFVFPDGRKRLGIYKFGTDGKLTLCYDRIDAPRPKSFDGEGSLVLVLEKVKD